MNIVSRNLLGLLAVLFVSGCSVLPKPAPEAIDTYVLEYTPDAPAGAGTDRELPVLIVTTPRAHGGYDTARIAYMQQTYGLRYYTRSRWADTPAHMLAPLIADAMQATGNMQALYATPGSITADQRLDTELIRFHQDFRRQPSEVRVSLRAHLVDLSSNRVIGTRQLDVRTVAETDDAYGGVVAANKAVQQLLDELTRFCTVSQP
jgi:cholesterol transport system auxiliary component